MNKFSYKAKKGPNEILEGVIEAENIDQAVLKIKGQGLIAIDINIYKEPKKRLKSSAKKNIFNKYISFSELVRFTRQIYDLTDANIPVLRALNIVSEQNTNSSFRKVLTDIRTSVEDGNSFSSALCQYPQIFSPLYVNMVKAGEMAGNLNVVLGRLADFLEKDQEVSSKVKTSLIYPSLILGVGFITIFVLLTFVIPQLTEMFQDLSQALPWPTTFLINLSGFLSNFWWLIVLSFIVFVFYIKQFASSAEGKIFLDRVKLKIPILGKLIQDAEIARFSKTLGTLLDSGVTIVPSLKAVSDVLTNEILRKEAKAMSEKVFLGMSLTESLDGSKVFPQAVIAMIGVGEESGQLERSLYKIASVYEKQAEQSIKTITSLLEPILIVFIGSVVGFVVIAMLLPIFQMNLMVG